MFHPDFPILITASEDGQVKFWNANTYKLEQNFNNRTYFIQIWSEFGALM